MTSCISSTWRWRQKSTRDCTTCQGSRNVSSLRTTAYCSNTTPKGLWVSISSHDPPSMSWRWYWILQATNIIARCHQKRILVFDIALRNFLLADDLSLRLIDFANSAPLPESMGITLADDDGCTARLDLLHLSSIIYSIMTWQKFSVRCDSETEWPKLDQMPDLEGLQCGQVIRNCWTRTYSTIQELA
jgi:serine/threonine protein kinase